MPLEFICGMIVLELILSGLEGCLCWCYIYLFL